MMPFPGLGLLLLAPLALAACTRVTALEGPPQDLHTVYTEALAAPRQPPTLQAKSLTIGPEAPYTPVMQPPQIQRVWVPDQLNSSGDLVSGHWVYLLLERSQWFLETLPPTLPPTVHVPLAPPVGLPPQEGTSRTGTVAPAGSRETSGRRARHPRGRPPAPTPAVPPAPAAPPRVAPDEEPQP
jgi:hypothetical protein